MKREEQNMQIAFFEWARWNERQMPELKLMHHIPNGGKRSKAEAAIFKSMGVRSGVPDVFLPAGHGIYHRLYIEFKTDEGSPSKNQIEFKQSLQEAGYFACVCRDVAKAIEITNEYLRLPKVNILHLLTDKYGEKTAHECMMIETDFDRQGDV